MSAEHSTTKRKPRTLLGAIRSGLVRLLVFAIVLLAVYVSAGRQFMPVISRYSAFFENQILQITGVPVRVESLRGNFSGFDPVIEVSGLSMQVAVVPGMPQSQQRAFDFDRGRVVVDMARSIWQRRWVLREFIVERLELDLEQTSDGGWLLGDIAMPGGGVDPDILYRTFLDFAQLDLRDVALNLRTRTGQQLRFVNGEATIQNRNGNHFLHVDITPEGRNLPLALSLEVRGGELSLIDGRLHLAVPAADYSDLAGAQPFSGFQFQQLRGGGDIWVDFSRGEVRYVLADGRIDELTLASGGGPTTLNALEGAFELRNEGATTHLTVDGLSFDYLGASSPQTRLYLTRAPGQSLLLRADRFDLAQLASLASNLELLPEAAESLVGQLQPAGLLENFAMQVPLRENSGELASVRANMVGAAVASVRNSPAMSGLTGYVEVSADIDARRATGLIEVDSSDFTINIPRVYTSTWAFDEMNGSLGFELDYSEGQKLRLASSVLAGRSGELETRLQLRSALEQKPDGERENKLGLLVGVLNMNAADKTPYLPDGPGVRDGPARRHGVS